MRISSGAALLAVASIAAATSSTTVSGFVPASSRPIHSSSLFLSVRSDNDDEKVATDTRRGFMVKSLATVGSAAVAATTGFGVLAPTPALAVKGTDKVNASLRA